MPTISHGNPLPPSQYLKYNWDSMQVGSKIDFDIGEVNPRTLRNVAYRAGLKRKTKYSVHKNDDDSYSVLRTA